MFKGIQHRIQTFSLLGAAAYQKREKIFSNVSLFSALGSNSSCGFRQHHYLNLLHLLRLFFYYLLMPKLSFPVPVSHCSTPEPWLMLFPYLQSPSICHRKSASNPSLSQLRTTLSPKCNLVHQLTSAFPVHSKLFIHISFMESTFSFVW